MRNKYFKFCTLSLFMLASSDALAQPAPVRVTNIDLALSNKTDDEQIRNRVYDALQRFSEKFSWSRSNEYRLLFATSIDSVGALTQLDFGIYRPPQNTFVVVFSDDFSAIQRLGAEQLDQSDGKSAIFQAGRLTLATVLQTTDISLTPEISQKEQKLKLRIIQRQSLSVTPRRSINPQLSLDTQLLSLSSDEDLCGNDDRNRSTDPKVGRLMSYICTGWLVSNDVGVTAGHCIDDETNIIEFQVPSSTIEGESVPSHPDDQYPIVKSSIVSKRNLPGQDRGNDWAIFRIAPNSNTGKMPGVRQGGYFSLSQMLGSTTVAIVGYGKDKTPAGPSGRYNSDNVTQQKHQGQLVRRYGNPDEGPYLTYSVDVTSGGSGSPVIAVDGGTQSVIGIHTDGGCTATGVNSGTSLSDKNFREALSGFVNLSVAYVD